MPAKEILNTTTNIIPEPLDGFNSSPTGDYAGQTSDSRYLFADQTSTYWQGVGASFGQAWSEQPLSNMAYSVEYGYDKYVDPGKTLSPEEYKQSEFYRPGLPVEQTTEALAKLRADSFDSNERRKAILATTSDGILQTGSDFVASLAATAVDPINAVSFSLAPELIGTKSSALLDALNVSRESELARSTISGAVEGTLALSPQAALQFGVSRLKGRPESWQDAFLNVGTGAALGAVVGGVKYAVSPVSDFSHSASMEKAVSQAENGKSVDIEPVLKQGAYQSSKDMDFDIESGHKPSIDEQVSALQEERAPKESALNDRVEQSKSILSDVAKSIRSVDVSALLDEKDDNISGLQQTASQALDADNLASLQSDIAETQNQVEGAVTEADRQSGQQKLDALQQQLDSHNQGMEAKRSIDKEISDKKKIESFKNKALKTSDKIDSILEQPRISDEQKFIRADGEISSLINKAQKSSVEIPKEVLDTLDSLDNISREMSGLKNSIESIDSGIDALRANVEPLALDNLKKASDAITSSNSDAEIDPKEIKEFTDTVDSLSEEPSESDEELKQMAQDAINENPEISENEPDIGDVERFIDGKEKAVASYIKAAVDCLMGVIGG